MKRYLYMLLFLFGYILFILEVVEFLKCIVDMSKNYEIMFKIIIFFFFMYW